MNQSYILTEIEFGALAAKEGIGSCWLFQPDISFQGKEGRKDPAGKKTGYERREEVETVFGLVKKGLLLVSDSGAKAVDGLGRCFALIRNAENIATVESSISEEQPSCIYCQKGQYVLLTIPKTDAAGMRLTLYRNSDDLIRDIRGQYELVEGSELQDSKETEEVPPGEQAGKSTSFRWVEWCRRSPDPEKIKAPPEESLLYTESQWGTELLRTAEGHRESVYYSDMELLRMLGELLGASLTVF